MGRDDSSRSLPINHLFLKTDTVLCKTLAIYTVNGNGLASVAINRMPFSGISFADRGKIQL